MNKIFLLVFVVITIVRALKSAAGEKKGEQRVDANAPQRRRRLQSEVEALLTEMNDENPDPSAQTNQQKSQQQRRRTQQRRQQQVQQQNAAQQQARFERQAKNSPTPQQSLDSGIDEYVDPYRSQQVAEYVETDVDIATNPDDVDHTPIVDSVESHLGKRPTELPPLTSAGSPQATSASEFRKLLKSRSGVRQAVLLNEVLQRPRSLRR
jgi:hypothetical protein